ncbi:acetyl-CoA acetyltransferase [Gordonia sp. NB41Y]|uniref:acetyl-CoA acetyltransferase n=1 Tax=Gordonia sp. NB41Y TaxID=875808 RepID=UPI0006B16913|nr:acetyl-CoA acetyltransferase [Gordonia sp. NB41Y]EMP14815.2 acetyl-CoA acetyltransferase [Gordonia sp. NB41Y]WLP92442.1 acetyl-CoA acetyltransferase [Gordonia sp. NB41Y]
MAPRVSLDELDPRTPVLIGVGQASERLTDPDYRGLGEADLAAQAVREALADTGIDPASVAAEIDTVVAVRSFEVSSPLSAAPLGRPDNMPRAVAARTGLDPATAITEVVGGQSPQKLVTEFAQRIADGRTDGVVIVGAEVISTVRHAMSELAAEDRPDFAEHVDGSHEDRGFGLAGLTTAQEARHHLIEPLLQYALLENARRHRIGLSRTEYARSMAELFAPMSQVAATNPHAASRQSRTADELLDTTNGNRALTDPYTRLLVSRDQVNQAASVILMSVGRARALGIDPARCVFLHGHSDLRERPLMERPDLSQGPAATAALGAALEMAGTELDEIAFLDLYSCFPIAVFTVCDAFGLSADDPRGLTVTGGLPYFGGPGNNYSMHAIAEIAGRVRARPGTLGLVAANGGVLSKYSVGIYSTDPVAWHAADDARRQCELDAAPGVDDCHDADGTATIETYTITPPDRKGRRRTIVIGRLDDDTPNDPGRRFIANVADADEELLDRLATADDPIGTAVFVRSFAHGNRVAVSEERMTELFPVTTHRFRDAYEHIGIRREGHLLEVTIDRPGSRNALNPKANAELDEIFDAYFADPDLWVAILTGAGDKAFSSGNDLAHMAGDALLAVPKNGFGGLTSRPTMPKPVIAAVNGLALGGGLEIALACHIIVADEQASFGLPEVKVGLAAAAGGLVRLPRALGPALARDMILTGRRIDTAEAHRIGLVSRIAEHGRSLEVARAVAAEILAGSPTAVRASLAAMAAAEQIPDPVEAIGATTPAVLNDLLISQDTMEGVLAFVTKRAPNWTGR